MSETEQEAVEPGTVILVGSERRSGPLHYELLQVVKARAPGGMWDVVTWDTQISRPGQWGDHVVRRKVGEWLAVAGDPDKVSAGLRRLYRVAATMVTAVREEHVNAVEALAKENHDE